MSSTIFDVTESFFNEFRCSQRITSETADGKARAVDSEGRNNRIDAGAICQTRVTIGEDFINSATHCGDNPVNDGHQVRVIPETGGGTFQQAVSFNVDVLVGIHQDVGMVWSFISGSRGPSPKTSSSTS